MKQVALLITAAVLTMLPPSLLANGTDTTPVKPVSIHHKIAKKVRHSSPVRPAGFTFYPGSLRDNIERVAAHYGWKQVVWNVPYDYNWVGQTIMQSSSLQVLLRHVLEQYPLQAVFYQGNHVLVIVPRVLK